MSTLLTWGTPWLSPFFSGRLQESTHTMRIIKHLQYKSYYFGTWAPSVLDTYWRWANLNSVCILDLWTLAFGLLHYLPLLQMELLSSILAVTARKHLKWTHFDECKLFQSEPVWTNAILDYMGTHCWELSLYAYRTKKNHFLIIKFNVRKYT